MAEERTAVFNGGPFQSYWWADEHEPVHLSIRARLDHGVDPAALERAWERTLRVYPLLDLVPDDEDEEVLFFAGKGESRPVRSRIPLRPAGEAVLGRGFALTWFEDTVTLTCYHSLADEHGLNEIFRTLLACYFSDRTGSAPVPGAVPEEGRRPEEYFVQNTVLPAGGFEPLPVALYRDIREIYLDPDAANADGSAGTAGTAAVPLGAWQALCESSGVSSESLLLGFMAEAVRGMDPGDGRKLCLGAMTDFRDTFSVPETIAPCSKKMPVILSPEETAGHGPDIARRIERIRAGQRTDAYIRSHVAMENTYSVLNIRNACFSLQFCGAFDLGEDTRHVLDLTMWDYSLRSAFALRLGDELRISFQYGEATRRYMDVFAAALREAGADARTAAEPAPIPAEAEQPVL